MTREELLELIEQAVAEDWTELDLAGLGLTELPGEIGRCTQLETLVLGKWDREKKGKRGIEGYEFEDNRLVPIVSGNKLKDLPAELANLVNLRKLDLSGNPWEKLPDVVLQLRQLEQLKLIRVDWQEIPEEIAQLSQLTELDLSHNQITQIPEAIAQLSQLTELDLSHNQITQIPEAIAQLSQLTQLYLTGNRITQIPEALAQLSHLTELYLSDNQITQIPEALAQLSQLTQLYLSSNQITEIPEALAQLSQLTQLHLTGNRITQIPEALAQLSQLTQLYLLGNRITEIPEAIAQLSQLTQLSLGGNQITQIPEEIAQLSQLTQLHLDGNRITEIPEAIAQLSQLTQLYLWNNQITEIPEAIAQLSQLTQLHLSHNQITQIPEELAQLSQLTQLNLSHNQITQIPEELAQLSQLTQLSLSYNQITQIPEAIRRLEKLETLDLRGNPLPIPPEILQGEKFYEPGDVRTILDFYFQTRDPNATEELNEAKLLIVGEGDAGKTSLAQKLLDPNYKLKPQEPSTEGIDVLRWEFQQANGKPFRVHLWDFGGQAIYHATHQFFLTERSLYILLVDDRRENPNLCYWLSIIELLSSKSPVFLVQNEKQDCRCQINVSQLRRDFDNLEKNYTTNLATHRGLDELKRAICHRITTLDHVGTPIPKPWANVRHVVENYAQRKTRIDVSEFFNLCATQGFNKSDKHAMLSLSKYLHDLGILLHFQKDSTLKHLVILRPEWATNAVYKVTKNKQVIANCGYFTDDNLREIWSDDEYDDLHDELLQLMKNFKLCYEIPPDRSGRYIAPQLLPLEPPNYTWDDTDNLIVRYEYDFMPKGILTRLIVEMHRLICRVDPPQPPLKRGENSDLLKVPLKKGDLGGSPGVADRSDLVWRDGVLLTDGYANAEVIENYHQREIRIRVSGTQKKTLLERIRYELWKIHSSYDDRLKFQEFIPCNCAKCKGNPDPHLYNFDNLRRRLYNGRYEVECEKHYVMVRVRGLMDDFPDYLRQGERERFSGKEYDDRVDRPSSQQIVYNLNLGDNKMTQDSPKTNNFNGPMSGVIGSDNATVSGNQFIQTNNANTAELLKLISSLRETASQFPEDIREGVIIDIEDVEAEIQKPENERNQARLKKSLKAIVGAAMAIGVGVAGVTEFANTAIDVANKVGIEIQLPQAR
jgi:internalin A